jgi:hypothetical protein
MPYVLNESTYSIGAALARHFGEKTFTVTDVWRKVDKLRLFPTREYKENLERKLTLAPDVHPVVGPRGGARWQVDRAVAERVRAEQAAAAEKVAKKAAKERQQDDNQRDLAASLKSRYAQVTLDEVKRVIVIDYDEYHRETFGQRDSVGVIWERTLKRNKAIHYTYIGGYVVPWRCVPEAKDLLQTCDKWLDDAIDMAICRAEKRIVELKRMRK